MRKRKRDGGYAEKDLLIVPICDIIKTCTSNREWHDIASAP